MEPRTILSDKYDRALSLARRWHARDVRRGTDVPYVAHLLAVSSIVLEAGGDEPQAIAGLLHDALEDATDVEEYRQRRARIAALGPEIVGIVEACTDGTPEERRVLTWRERKSRYLAHLEDASVRALLVAAADKLHNARGTLYDVRRQGRGFLDRFHAPPDDTLWYYRELSRIFSDRFADDTPSGRLARELARVVMAIEEAL